MADNRRSNLFNFKLIPMDIGRIVSSITLLLFPTKKTYLSGKKEKVYGGAIVASNHISFKDPFIIGGVFWYRRVFFLAAKIVMKNKLVAFLLRKMGCIEIDRNSCDLTSIRKVVNILKKGHVVSVFPQGGIQNDNMAPLKSGIVLMAIKSKKPIIPVYITSSGIFKKGHAVIGKPLYFDNLGAMPSMSDINNATLDLQAAMNKCANYIEKGNERN